MRVSGSTRGRVASIAGTRSVHGAMEGFARSSSAVGAHATRARASDGKMMNDYDWLVVVSSGTKVEHSRRAIVARGDDARSVGTDGEIENRFRVPASLAHAGGRAGVPETDDAVDGGAAQIETFRQSNKDTRASEVNARVKENVASHRRATRSECVPGVIRARIEARRVYVRKLCPPPRVTCRNARGPFVARRDEARANSLWTYL